MPAHKRKPNYNAATTMQELLTAVCDYYGDPVDDRKEEDPDHVSLHDVADRFNITVIGVALDEAQIPYIPLKGAVLRKLYLSLPQITMEELNARFCLIYTGQRRLARNLLRDVVGRYIGNEPDTVYALNEIQRTAALMRFELERGHIDAFAELLSAHWKLSIMIDSGSTNTLIDQIFDSIDDLIDGRMVCGAGGGGFLQVVLKKGVEKSELQNRLKEVFSDTEINMWDCELV